ncbi:MAG: hypothetical protein AB1405_01630 [Bdellovibrionota bacterium]
MVLILLALVPIVVGHYASNRSLFRATGFWYFIGGVGESLWILSYAGIELAPSNAFALWATRSAWIGPALGASAAYLGTRAFVTDQKSPSFEIAAAFLVSLAFHLPAVLTSGAVVSVDISGFQPVWKFGPYAIVPAAFWATVIAANLSFLIRHRKQLSWDKYNRMIILCGVTSVVMIGQLVTNQILPNVLGNTRYYLIGPSISVIPFVAGAWLLVEERLPDLWGALGKIFPNARSRFVKALENLEQEIEKVATTEGALDQLSGLFGARLSYSTVGTAGAIPGTTGRGFLWIPPSERARLYGPKDTERLRRIIDKIAKQPDQHQMQASAMHITGWLSETRIDTPRTVPWVLGSVGSLQVTERIRLTLDSEGVALVQLQEDPAEFIQGIKQLVGRANFLELDYPDRMDGGTRLAGKLLWHSPASSSLFVAVRVHTDIRSPQFEGALAELFQQGAKLLLVSQLPLEQITTAQLFKSFSLRIEDIATYEVPRRPERIEDLSVLVDHYLAQIETDYGRRFFLTPEERQILCSHAWTGSTTMLRGLLERMILTRWGGRPEQSPIAS